MLPMLASVAVVLIVGIAVLKIYNYTTTGVCKSTNRLDGKTVLITGANSGIGKETALDLASRGARVILACRDLNKAENVKEEIVRETGNTQVIVKHLDLCSLKKVRQFAAEVLQSEPRLDVLVNNAGCGGMRRKWTEDGFEYMMASNYFGHFLLTNLLLGLLLKSKAARIVNVSSEFHFKCKKLDLGNLNFKGKTDSGFMDTYHASKLAVVLSTVELARKLNSSGKSNVVVNCLHPGVVHTDFARFVPVPRFLYSIGRLTFGPLLKTAKEGAQTSIFLAVADEAEGVSGKYFVDCKVQTPSKLADDAGLAKKLWEVTEQLVGLATNERHY